MSPEDCRGIWESEQAYIAAQIAEHLPDHVIWLIDCCDPDRLRERYEAGKIVVWSMPLRDGRVMVFETVVGAVRG